MTIKVIRDQSLPMRHIVHVRNHILSADGSVEEGGSDAGPSPHDLYDAALSSCKALTVVWYARHKGIPLEGVEVTMERDASDERKGTYRLAATLHLTGYSIVRAGGGLSMKRRAGQAFSNSFRSGGGAKCECQMRILPTAYSRDLKSKMIKVRLPLTTSATNP